MSLNKHLYISNVTGKDDWRLTALYRILSQASEKTFLHFLPYWLLDTKLGTDENPYVPKGHLMK